MKTLLFFLTFAIASSAHAQIGDTYPTTRTMESLIAEGYEPSAVQVFKDKIWMRKEALQGIAYVCERGRIGSAAFDAYREKKYDKISCTLQQ